MRRTGRAAAALLALTACTALAACGVTVRSPLVFAGAPPEAADAVEIDALIADPGVYAGQEVTLVGALSEYRGQACLSDRGRRIAVRLTAEQAAYYSGVRDWPVVVRGTFQQALCPATLVCPELCAPFGLDAGVAIADPAAGP